MSVEPLCRTPGAVRVPTRRPIPRNRSGERHEVEQGLVEERPVTFRHQDDPIRF